MTLRLLISLAMSAAVLSCSTVQHGKSAASGIEDETVTGEIGTRIDQYLSRAAAFGFSGTVLVAIGDAPVLHKGFAFANISAKQPNTPRTIYDIGSITKPLTGMGILLLASEGKLSVEDKIGRFLQGVPKDKEEIQLKHLLTHTSGFVDPPLGDYEPIGRDDLMKVMLAAPLGAAIGTKYNYSNTGFSMLAAIIEIVTGMPYEEFMRKRLFLPAGMHSTGYVQPAWQADRVAHTYTLPVDHGSPLDRLRAANGPGWILVGNGGLLGTTGDLFRWEQAMREGRIVPSTHVALAFQRQFQRSSRESVGYDWQISTSETGEVSFGHASDAGYLGLSGWYGRYPASNAAIFLLANNRLNGASTRHFLVPNLRKAIAGEPLTLPPVVQPTRGATHVRLEGTYSLDQQNEIAIKANDGRFELGAIGQAAVDVFNRRQGAEAVEEARRLNNSAGDFLAALQSQDTDRIARYLPDEHAGATDLLVDWRAVLAKHGDVRSIRVLGTYRLDRRAYLTTAKVTFTQESFVLRFGWQADKVVGNTEDLMLPAFAGPLRPSPVPYAAWSPYWYFAEDRLFTFDLLTGTGLEATISEQDSHWRLVFEGDAAELGLWLRR